MLLYHCPECGYWQDVKLAEALTNMINEVSARLAQPSPVPTRGYPCPYGHGLLIQVLPNDRISVRSGVAEEDTGEHEAVLKSLWVQPVDRTLDTNFTL